MSKNHEDVIIIPSIGVIVHYRLTVQDCENINRNREYSTVKWAPVFEGVECACLITCVLNHCNINGQVFLDGIDNLWVQNIKHGALAGQWHYSGADCQKFKQAREEVKELSNVTDPARVQPGMPDWRSAMPVSSGDDHALAAMEAVMSGVDLARGKSRTAISAILKDGSMVPFTARNCFDALFEIIPSGENGMFIQDGVILKKHDMTQSPVGPFRSIMCSLLAVHLKDGELDFRIGDEEILKRLYLDASSLATKPTD